VVGTFFLRARVNLGTQTTYTYVRLGGGRPSGNGYCFGIFHFSRLFSRNDINARHVRAHVLYTRKTIVVRQSWDDVCTVFRCDLIDVDLKSDGKKENTTGMLL